MSGEKQHSLQFSLSTTVITHNNSSGCNVGDQLYLCEFVWLFMIWRENGSSFQHQSQ